MLDRIIGFLVDLRLTWRATRRARGGLAILLVAPGVTATDEAYDRIAEHASDAFVFALQLEATDGEAGDDV